MKSSLISRITLWSLLVFSAVILGLFYLGGTDGTLESGTDVFDIPAFTDTLLNWTYILFGVALIATIVSVVLAYAIDFKVNAKGAIKSLLSILLVVLLFVVTFFLGSGEKIDIVGYEGTDNVGFWAQFTDMCIYSVYVLLIVAVVAIIGSSVYKKIKK